MEPSIGNDEAEEFFMTLSKILNHTTRCDEVVYSLTWYCKSLGEGDIKTKFICRYIGFEALSGIWTKTNKKEKSLQDKVKYTIPALFPQI